MSSGMNAETIRQWLEEKNEERSTADWITDLGPFVLLILMVILFSALSNNFLTYGNLVSNVAKNSAFLLLVGLAGTFPILQTSIDLSVAKLVTISGVTTAVLIPEYGPLAIVGGLLAGMIAGAVNGIVFAKLKVPSFLVTLGTMSIMSGVALSVADGSAITYRNDFVRSLASEDWLFGVPNLVMWALIFYVIAIFIAFRTRFGRYCFGIGYNEDTLVNAGIDVDRYKIYAFVLSGFFCGVAGVLLTSRVSSGSPYMGDGLLLTSIAAIVMGGTALTGGVGGPHRTILGVAVIAVLQNGMNQLSVDPFVQEIILGLVVVAAVALSIDHEKIDIIK